MYRVAKLMQSPYHEITQNNLNLCEGNWMRFPTPHFLLDLLCDLTNPRNIVPPQDLLG